MLRGFPLFQTGENPGVSAMLSDLKPAQKINVTIKSVPRRQDARQTIARLMRQDDEIKAALRRTQSHRRRVTVVKTRAGRPWSNRLRRTLIAKVEAGNSWTMPYFPHLANDLNSVADYLEIKSA
jgi:hypothetical protein